MRNTARLALFIILAVLFLFELHGQAPPIKNLILETEVRNSEFLNGQNIEIRFGLSFKSKVQYSLAGLNNLGENFRLVEMNSTDPIPIADQKEYSYVIITMIIEPKQDLAYGKYEIRGLFVDYHFIEMIWVKDAREIEVLQPKKNEGKENAPVIILEKVPLTAFIESNEGMHEVINISEHTVLKLVILKEKNLDILNYLSPAEKNNLGLIEATDLDSPILKPFSLLKSRVSTKDRGQYEELTYQYSIASYDISLIKMFEIPSINVFYRYGGEQKQNTNNEIKSFKTPVIKVRTNSVLLDTTEFKPLKDRLDGLGDRDKYLFGELPISIATFTLLSATLIFVCAILTLLFKYLMRARKTGFVNLFKDTYQKAIEKISKLEFISRRKMTLALSVFIKEPTNDNLIRLIKTIRGHIGNMARLDSIQAQALTSEELLTKLKVKHAGKNTMALKVTEHLLDASPIAQRDITEVEKQISELNKKKFGNTKEEGHAAS